MTTTRLEFHNLTFVEDSEGVTIGRSDIESYAVLPVDGAALLRRLIDGMPVEEAEQWYSDTFGETVDMTDFLEGMRELEFLRLDGEELAVAEPVSFQALGRAVFSPAAWVLFALIGAAAIYAMITHPALRPAPRNVFFVSSLVIVQISLVVMQPLTTLLHECFHVLAGRRLGLPTKLGVGRRMYYFVFETQLNGLLGVEKKKRYLPFLAGMLADLLMFAALTLFAWADSGWPGRLALAIGYMVVLRLIWQLYVFLRTDLYYVFVTLLGCTDLHGTTTNYLRRKFSWLPKVKPATDDDAFSERDRRIAPWFAGITLLGGLALLATVALGVIPLLVNFVTRLFSALQHGFTGGAAFWDSVLFLLLAAFELVVLPMVAGRRRGRTRTA